MKKTHEEELLGNKKKENGADIRQRKMGERGEEKRREA